jgi:hypothetical protein
MRGPHFAYRASRVALGTLLGLIVSNGLVLRLCWAQPGERGASAAPESALTEARQRYQHALTLFEKGEHRAALAEFEQAYRLAPSFRIHYNIALVNMALDDSAGAIQAFERYLQEGGANVSKERSDEVAHQVSRLSRRAASLTLDVAEPDAQVFVDSTEVGKSPLWRRVWVNQGHYSVSVRRQDGHLETRDVDVGGGDERILSFAPSSIKAPELPASPQTTAPAIDVPASRAHSWIPYAITGALGAATIATGTIALVERANERAAQQRQGVSAGELRDARSTVEHWALTTDLLMGASAVAAGVSIYLALRPTTRGHGASLLVSPPGGVSLRWNF